MSHRQRPERTNCHAAVDFRNGGNSWKFRNDVVQTYLQRPNQTPKKNGLHVSQELHLGSSGSTGSTESEGNWGEESSSWPAMGEQTEQKSFDLENLE